MPFYLAPKTTADRVLQALASHDVRPSVRSCIAVFDDPKDAHAANLDKTANVVRFYQTESERVRWHYRERSRFSSGEYVKTPWASREQHYEHFAHLSIKHPGMVAYTESDERGHLDRQTVTRPGRYLERFYPDMSTATRADYVAKCSADRFDLKIATSADDIEAVYTADGPSSCMSETESNYSSCCHPVRVYGDSDLALAYLGDVETKVSARAIIWPEKKLYSRVYGSEHTMIEVLTRNGYTAGSMRGAFVRLIEDEDGIVMPYVDGISGAERSRTRPGFVRLGSGDISTTNTDGIGYGGDHEDENLCSCDRCGEEFNPDHDDDARDGFCGSCARDYVECEECGTGIFRDDRRTFETANGHVCRTCYNNVRHDCAACDSEFFDCDFRTADRQRRERHGTDVFCSDCEHTHTICPSCESAYSNDEDRCPNCDRAPRCEHTADLLEPVALDDASVRLVRAGDTIRQAANVAPDLDVRTWTHGEPTESGRWYTLVRVVNGHGDTDIRHAPGTLIACKMPDAYRATTIPAHAETEYQIPAVLHQMSELQRLYPLCEYRIVSSVHPLPETVSFAGIF